MKKYIIEARKLDKSKCYYCGIPLDRTNRSVDHIIPVKKGGTDFIGNLAWSCRWCNSLKGHSDEIGFRMFLKYLIDETDVDFPKERPNGKELMRHVRNWRLKMEKRIDGLSTVF